MSAILVQHLSVIVGSPPACKEVSVSRNTATETQTLKWGREGKKPGREPQENDQNSENQQKVRDPAPT